MGHTIPYDYSQSGSSARGRAQHACSHWIYSWRPFDGMAFRQSLSQQGPDTYLHFGHDDRHMGRAHVWGSCTGKGRHNPFVTSYGRCHWRIRHHPLGISAGDHPRPYPGTDHRPPQSIALPRRGYPTGMDRDHT